MGKWLSFMKFLNSMCLFCIPLILSCSILSVFMCDGCATSRGEGMDRGSGRVDQEQEKDRVRQEEERGVERT